LDILKSGLLEWNNWRKENPSIKPDLSKVDLSNMKLSLFEIGKIRINRVNFDDTNFIGSKLNGVFARSSTFNKALFQAA
jgi:uncharacterized protein YjbI with pentapeptide repeats